VNGTVQDFRAAYGAAFRSYVDDGTEFNLRTAYELGRDAVVRDLSVLDLTLIHHDALLDALREGGTADVEHITRAASAFVLESLSAFEMVRRGFNEAKEAALLERRQAAMLRQLSNFLADISLALATPDPLEEMLQLVAEQARELVGCGWCRVSIAVGPDGVREAISGSETKARTLGPSRSSHEGSRGAMTGISAAASDDFADFRRTDTPMSSEGRTFREGTLAAPLTALDGRAIGSLELACKRDGDFSGVDEAILANLAQMVSAAVERNRLYQRDS
jgi:GAF domain-containing protein/phosphoserine phosphatase RsbU-like protein